MILEHKGLELSQKLYDQVVAPVLKLHFPEVLYAAARIGRGSEVLGYDTDMSVDHDFGPCLQLFLPESVFCHIADNIMHELEKKLPEFFEGYRIHYSDVARPPGAGHKRTGMLGSTHGVELYTLPAWSQRFLQHDFSCGLTTKEWLYYPEQFFLMITAGAVFRDDTGELTTFRQKFSYFPHDVWLYKLAAQWGRISDESLYVGRSGSVEDELGSRIIATRMVGNLMRLSLLIEKKYAPYTKWFGTAFSRLDCAPELTPLFEGVLGASNWKEREARLIDACLYLANLQVKKEISGAISPTVTRRRNRPFCFVDSLKISASLRSAIKDKAIAQINDFGAVDQFIDNDMVLSVPDYAKNAASTLLNLNLSVD